VYGGAAGGGGASLLGLHWMCIVADRREEPWLSRLI